MSIFRKSVLSMILATSFVGSNALATESNEVVSWENGELHTVSLMMSEPMMKVDGSYHELLDSFYLKPLLTDDKVVLAPLDDIFDELNGEVSYQGDTVTFGINGHTVTMKVGSKKASVDGKEVTAPVAPSIIEEATYVPFKFVMESLGGKYKWNGSRQLAEVSILRPAGSIFKTHKGAISLKTIGKQKPEWYASAQALQVAEAFVANQNADGGWFKIGSSNDLTVIYNRETFPLYRQKSTIDNDATNIQIETLAKIYQHQKDERFRDSAIKGIEYLVNGQYASGGWPQFFPQTTGYHRHITFNDNAISNTLEVLRDVSNKTPEYAFVPEALAQRAKVAMEKGLRFVLDQQVEVNGVKTGWCAQYHYETLECERGRSYELASISGDESVKVIKFLMSIEDPSAEIIEAINSAVSFLHSQSIENTKLVKPKDDTLEFGKDRIAIEKKGSTVWPRFIELETLKPLFSNRQGDRLDAYEKVSYERRVKYSWLVTSPGKMMKNDYPAWQGKYSPEYNALER